jgi:translation initiation factor IF-3
MKELHNIYQRRLKNSDDFLENIKVIFLPDVRIFDIEDRLQYCVYWKQKDDKISATIDAHGYEILGSEGQLTKAFLKNVSTDLNDMLTCIADRLSPKSVKEMKDLL